MTGPDDTGPGDGEAAEPVGSADSSDGSEPTPAAPPVARRTFARRPDRRPPDRRWPILIVVVVALLFAAVVDRVVGHDRSSAGAEVAGPEIPAADAVSSAWYCALGSSAPDGTMDETVIITNLGAQPAKATVTVMPGGGAVAVTRDVDLPARAQARVRVADVLATAQPGVLVETFGGPAVVEHLVTGNGDDALGPCATGPSADWHFAAGTTDKGAQLWLALYNPFGDDAIVDLTFLTDGGFLAPSGLQGIVVPRRTRVMVPIHDTVQRQASVATQVSTRTGRVVAEQALVRDADPKGLAVSLGAPDLASIWSFPGDRFAGATPGGNTIAIANPGPSPATVTVDVHLDGDATLAPQTVVVPSQATVSFDAATRVPAGLGSWVSLDAHGTPIVAEQVLTRPPSGLAVSLGTAAPVRRWALAAATIEGDAADTVTVVNPGTATARVVLRVISGGRETVAATITVTPGRRSSFDLTQLKVTPTAGLVIDASRPVAVVRENLGSAGVTASPGIPGAANGAGG